MNKRNLPEYRAWKAMKSRCYSPSTKEMGNYRKRRIIVCKRWINNFDAFYKDMGNKPSNMHSLDRINPYKSYSKKNCRWANREEQAKNRGEFTPIYEHNGEKHILKDWSRILNINYTTLVQRINRSKLNFEEAIKEDPFNKLIEINGIKKNLKQWAKYYDRKYATIVCRIYDGWDKVKAIITPTIRNYNNELIKNEDIEL